MRIHALLTLSALAPFVACAQSPPADSTVAITHVTIIDGASLAPRRDQTVVIRGDRIVAAGPAVTVPPGARVIEGRDKYLVPGFWDMHVHTTVPEGRSLLALYVANGVTGVRDLASEWPLISTWRTEIARGELVGPRIIAAGPYLEGGAMPIPHLLARNPAEASAAVDSLIAMGVDVVKLHGQMNRETWFAAAHRARERGVPFTGHVPRSVGSAAASDSGISSIEHLLSVPMPCTSAESLALAPPFPVQAAIGRCSSEDQVALAARFVRNGTWLTPTFVAAYEIAEWPLRGLPGDSAERFLPSELRRFVLELFPMPDSIPLGAESVGRAAVAKRLKQVAALHRAGVGILTGTDAPLRNSPPGFGLHEEMALLVRGGMTPYEALHAATTAPVRFLGMLDSLGTVAEGKLADLVLLDADPLADIRNTRRINSVFARGRYRDRAALDSLMPERSPRGPLPKK
jgi:imidazolonepropionase-like amidohydrolase